MVTALVVGSSLLDEGHYSANVKPQLLDTSYNTHLNDEGIVVIDITSPEKPRYGFLWLGADMPRTQYPAKIPPLKVLDAKSYVTGYYNAAELVEHDVVSILQQFEDFPLINAATVNSLWRCSTFSDSPASANRSTTSVEDAVRSLSLRETTMSEVVKAMFEGDPSKLPNYAEAEQLSDFNTKVMAALTKEPSLLRSPSGFSLLLNAVKGTSELNLTPFEDISVAEVLRIVTVAASSGSKLSITLWLPENLIDNYR